MGVLSRYLDTLLARVIILISIVLMFLNITNSYAQKRIPNNNTKTERLIDSVLKNDKIDSIPESSFPQNLDLNSQVTQKADFKVAEGNVEQPINYNALDSFRMDVPNKTIHLYGEAQVEHDNITLKAAYIQYNWEKGEALAYGVKDSSGRIIGKPEFTESGTFYLADELKYNFKTKKGKSKGLVTKQDEGFLHGGEVKSFGTDYFYSKKTKYTTCDYEHPHYYIEIKKAKVIKDKVVLGKPANLVIGNTRTPLVFPLGVFPLRKNRASGFLLPNDYGRSDAEGIYFLGMGYYFAINDYQDLTTRFDVYTSGTWGVDVNYNFIKKYKFRNSLNLDFNTSRRGQERQDPNSTVRRDINLRWNMTIDQKRLNNSNFSTSVNFVTRAYQENLNVVNDIERFIDQSYNSSISYSKWWPGKLPRLSISARHSQNTRTGAVNVTLPSLNFNVNSFTPFERKVQTGGAKWYERLNMTYGLRFENQIATGDSIFFSRQTLQDMRNGINHTANVSLPFKLFKYFNFKFRIQPY